MRDGFCAVLIRIIESLCLYRANDDDQYRCRQVTIALMELQSLEPLLRQM